MGVVNVTPDSFSDGGRFLDPDAAIAHGLALVAAGAAVLDVGGESTRPGAEPVDADEELRRVAPGRPGARRRDRGAGQHRHHQGRGRGRRARGRRDDRQRRLGRHAPIPTCSRVVADAGAGYVAMHMQGEPRTMQHDPRLRRRRRRGRRRSCANGVDAAVVGRRSRATRSSPIRASASARPSSTTSRCSRALPELAARVDVPCSSARRASRSSAACSATLPVDDARRRARSPPRSGASTSGAAMVRVHDVAASRRAVALLDVLDRATPRGDGGMSTTGCGGAGRRASSRASSAGSSRTGSARASGRAGSPATTARCGARKS